jgi:hypothetical protein
LQVADASIALARDWRWELGHRALSSRLPCPFALPSTRLDIRAIEEGSW